VSLYLDPGIQGVYVILSQRNEDSSYSELDGRNLFCLDICLVSCELMKEFKQS
jgi:hypothetical protein